MKIAIVMRPMDQDNSGHFHYIENLVNTLLHMYPEHTYLLLYRTPKWVGRFAKFDNVKEILVKAPAKLLWDQVVVPYVCWKEQADVLYHSKFSVPLLSPCPVTMGLQEPAWWVWPDHYEKLDVIYERMAIPLFVRRSSHLFPWSQFILDENRRCLKMRIEHASVTYAGVRSSFCPIDDPAVLEDCRRSFELPEQFILSVTRVTHPGLERSQSFHSGKNVDMTMKVFQQIKDKIPHDLVIAGKRVREYLLYKGWNKADFERVHFLGSVAPDEIPKLHNCADAFVIPSYYEGFGFALAEALACGCPVVASNRGACPEIGGDAVLYADPDDTEAFAEHLLRILQNDDFRDELRRKSLERARFFSWERTAEIVMNGLLQAAGLSNMRLALFFLGLAGFFEMGF